MGMMQRRGEGDSSKNERHQHFMNIICTRKMQKHGLGRVTMGSSRGVETGFIEANNSGATEPGNM